MRDSRLNGTERTVQPRFSLVASLCLILLPFFVIAAADRLHRLPDRIELPDRVVPVRFEPIHVKGTAGAWAVEADDPRFGGVSAVVLRRGRLLALTDSGVILDLPKPGHGSTARLHDLPDGPGPAIHKRARDSEALVSGPAGDWLVTFENRHSLWRFDPGFTRATGRTDLSGMGWPVNKGAEAMVALPSGALLLIPEVSRQVIRINQRGLGVARLEGVSGGIADATMLPDGRVLVLVREVGPLGIRNRIAMLVRAGQDYRLRPVRTVETGPLINLEAITAEPLPSGATRLWLMSDNDFSTWRRTILLAIDLPKEP